MKREIKFRGKVKYNGNHYFSGQWIEGFYFENGAGEGFIVDTSPDNFGNIMFVKIQVDPETVSQYTGLKDKNGKEIYDGDILKTPCQNIDLGGEVYFENGSFWCEGNSISYHIGYGCEIIGNIHEEREL